MQVRPQFLHVSLFEYRQIERLNSREGQHIFEIQVQVPWELAQHQIVRVGHEYREMGQPLDIGSRRSRSSRNDRHGSGTSTCIPQLLHRQASQNVPEPSRFRPMLLQILTFGVGHVLAEGIGPKQTRIAQLGLDGRQCLDR